MYTLKLNVASLPDFLNLIFQSFLFENLRINLGHKAKYKIKKNENSQSFIEGGLEIVPFFMKHNTIITECVSIETDIIQAQLFLFKCCIVFGWSHNDSLINCNNVQFA